MARSRREVPGTADEVQPRQFRHVVGHLTSGVTVLTTAVDGEPFGMTASSVTSLSADPPMMLACVHRAAPTGAAMERSGHFVINVLAQGQDTLAHQFAQPDADKFRRVEVEPGLGGMPKIAGALAHIECEVVEAVEGGSHTVFMARVLAADAREGRPLTYFQGGFGRFEFTRDDEVYHALRRRVLSRDYAPEQVLDVEELANSLDVENAAAFYALTKLASDGLIRRDPDRGYVVTPFDARTSDEVFDARLAIELGVIGLVVGDAPSEQVQQLRPLYDAMASYLVGDRFVDFDAYVDANHRFHEAVVALAGSAALSNVFAGLGLKAVMTRSFGATGESSHHFLDAQRILVDAIEAADKPAALAAAREYCSMAKARARELLREHGGVL